MSEQKGMMRITDAWPTICSFEWLLKAHKNARKGKRYRSEVMAFSAKLEDNLLAIQRGMMDGSYRLGPYRRLWVYVPKKRLVMALDYPDRIVQWSLYQYLNPIYDKLFIEDSYACRKNKGSHRAAKRLQYWMRQVDRKPGPGWYYLKLDISKYFYRVDHSVLLEILGRRIADEKLMEFIREVVNSRAEAFGLPAGKKPEDIAVDEWLYERGMPIGNLTSQMFANIYLNELDQYAKHKLGAHYYVRYMDDVIILGKTKEELHRLKAEIEIFLRDKLRLELNSKTAIRPIQCGAEFVGVRIWPQTMRLRKSTTGRLKREVAKISEQYGTGHMNRAAFERRCASIRGLLEHTESGNIRARLNRIYRAVMKRCGKLPGEARPGRERGKRVEYKERLTRPTAGNGYYNNAAGGGFNPCIKGKCSATGTCDEACNVLPNCVGYAVGRFNEIGGYGACKWLASRNAENMAELARQQGLAIGTVPRVGAVMCWQKGATLNGSDGAGHVAVVERVVSATEVVTSESGYNAKSAFWTQTRKKGNGLWGENAYKFLGFIYNPATETESEKVGVVKGIDVSHHQGAIDWQKTASELRRVNGGSNAGFAILRAGYSNRGGKGGLIIDSQFEANRAGCEANGVPAGVYFYCYDTSASAAVVTAQQVVKLLAGHKYDYPIYYDVEYEPFNKAAGKATNTAMILAALNVLQKAGYYAAVYCSRNFFVNYTNLADLKGFDKWEAAYTAEDNDVVENGMWQYGSANQLGIAGFGNSLDCDVAYTDYPAIMRRAGLNGYTAEGDTGAEKEQAAEKTVAEVAAEVLNGEWGNGQQRREKLTAAGYDYAEVQAAVNKMVAGAASTPALKTVSQIATEVLAGKWGNGAARKRALTQAGYNYEDVQAAVNNML